MFISFDVTSVSSRRRVCRPIPTSEQQEGVSRIHETRETPSMCRRFASSSSALYYRFPRFCRLDSFSVNLRLILQFASQFFVGNAATGNLSHYSKKSIRVSTKTFIESKRLFIQVSEHMKRFNTHTRSFDRPFKERPEIFNAVGMNIATNDSSSWHIKA